MATWLVIAADGAARRVGNLGLLIGRAPMCDLVLEHAEISRRHLLLQHDARGGLDILPMAGARTTLNAVVIERAVAASDQDVLGFPGGATLRLACTDAPVAETAPWLLEVGGRRIGLRTSEIELGGGDDEIVIEDWPPAGLRLAVRDDALAAEARCDGFIHGDAPMPAGQTIALRSSDRIAYGGREVRFVADARDPEPTRRDDSPRAITLEMLPTGGLVRFAYSTGERRAMLAERRFALATVLLVPPSPFRAGEFIPDEVVFSAVWPRNDGVDRSDLNQLVFRLRADLTSAGIDGGGLVDRFAKGGATRFVVGASVAIKVVT